MRSACRAFSLLLLLSLAASARAEQTTNTAPLATPNNNVSTSARLDFTINIGRFLFFRLGTGAYPTASSTVDTLSFNGSFSIPAVPTTPVNGNNTPLNWSGGLPGFSPGATVSLPVEVASNAGQVSLRTTVTTSLASGANVIPFSDITITSSDANLPAPLIPNSGTGSSVNVVGSAFINLVTQRSATWVFAYNPLTTPVAGAYTGLLTFSASVP